MAAPSTLIASAHRLPDGAALLVLKQPIKATCCDGRLVFFVVNREGQTRCVNCDPWLPRCMVCGEDIPKGTGLSNAHGRVCGHQCAGVFNRREKQNYAWGPNR